jgi:YndJ-like protein
MQESFDSRWTRKSAMLGAVLWVAIAVLVLLGRAPLGVIELLFLLAPLVVVPLGFAVLDRHGGGPRPAALDRAVRLLQPLGALLAVASFWFPPGRFAGALSAGWPVIGALTALMAVLDLLRPGWRALDRMVFNVARVDLAIAGCWFVTSRLGVAPMGFQEPIVLLTGVHFHYSGFATALIAGVTPEVLRAAAKIRLGGVDRGGCGVCSVPTGGRVRVVAAAEDDFRPDPGGHAAGLLAAAFLCGARFQERDDESALANRGRAADSGHAPRDRLRHRGVHRELLAGDSADGVPARSTERPGVCAAEPGGLGGREVQSNTHGSAIGWEHWGDLLWDCLFLGCREDAMRCSVSR